MEQPMTEHTIFSIASCTKPITCTGLMILYDKGYFQLDDPIEQYIPEFSDMTMINSAGEIQPCDKPFTIRDLLGHTAGFTYNKGVGQLGLGKGSVAEAYDTAGIFHDTLETVIPKIAQLPLTYQPGTEWQYSIGIDIVGYLIEVLSQQTLDKFLYENLFTPLKMKNTYFKVPDTMKEHLAQ